MEVFVKEDKAYYFHRTYLDDPSYVTVDVMPFEKKNAAWKLASKGGIPYSFPKKYDTTNETGIYKKIKEFKDKLIWKEYTPKYFTRLSMQLPPAYALEETEKALLIKKDPPTGCIFLL